MILSRSCLQASVYYIRDLCHCEEALRPWPLLFMSLLPPAQRSCSPKGPAVCLTQAPAPLRLFVKGISLPAPGLETDAAPFCIWFLTRHQSCGIFQRVCHHGASLLSLVHVRARADCEATASQQGLSDLSQTGRLQEPRAADQLPRCLSPWHCSLFTHVPSLSPSCLPSPPTSKHG